MRAGGGSGIQAPARDAAPAGRRRGSRPLLVLLLVASLGAAGFSFLNTPFTGAASPALPVFLEDAPLPLDPTADFWDDVPATLLSLSAQIGYLPKGGGSIKDVSVQLVRNESWLAVRLQWDDATADTVIAQTDDFSDAVAVQLAGGTATLPFVCMGQLGSQVEIWQWRAERDPLAGGGLSYEEAYPGLLVDYYPFENESTFYPAWAAGNFLALANNTPVETLTAAAPGTLTTVEAAPVWGAGAWEAGQWSVLFARPLLPPGEGVTVEGDQISVAFAAWDGARDERDGQKSTSSWYPLSFRGAVPHKLDLTFAFAIGLPVVIAAVLIFLLLGYLRRRPSPYQKGRGGKWP